MHRHFERFPFDVPEREVHGPQGMRLLAARWIEPRDEHLLPDRFDLERVLADERAGTLFERVLRTAFADARETHVGFDGADQIALIEE